MEEVGELSHAHLKREQGIRGTEGEHTLAIEDAVADIVIFLADYCNSQGIDLESTVVRVWDTVVKPRDWVKERSKAVKKPIRRSVQAKG